MGLDREPLGGACSYGAAWLENPQREPAKYMWFEGYLRYGVAIWQAKRMIDLALWSSDAMEDMSEYYRRWFTFLSPVGGY